MAQVLEYKCPCCGAGLVFGDASQKLTCEYCENEFDLDTIEACSAAEKTTEDTTFQWGEQESQSWTEEEQQQVRYYICPSCGGQILTDANTAATFCPYCENPTIMPQNLANDLRPDGVISFKTNKHDAQNAFLQLAKKKPLLPKFFMQQQRIEHITGMYVPFWLYDCGADLQASYKATRVHHWSDSKYRYTKTDHYLLERQAQAAFGNIPMDASKKMDDAIMESIEPFDYSQIVSFDTAYLSGFLADKYDVLSSAGESRVAERIKTSMDSLVRSSMAGYSTVVPTSHNLRVDHGKAEYVLLPVWILNTRYKDKIYTFAMNGQTGKMTGTFPICPRRTAGWFSVIAAGVAVLTFLAQLVF